LTDAATVLARCAALGEISEEPGLLVRRFATPALREASDLVGEWMRQAGLDVYEDAVGNLIGRREAATGPGAPAFVLGSHLDTVRDAGRYDGPLGVVAGVAVAERFAGRVLPFALEVVAFADEEGTRFGTTFLGSSAFAGRWDPAWDALTDEAGVTLADALRAYGGDVAEVPGAARARESLLGYSELHIEQGPVLEARDAPVGVVTAITGQSHAEVRFTGIAGHAGTVPMDARHDAAAAAAEWLLVVESLARAREGLVATVGRLELHPGARNVIPAEARLWLDVRHGDDRARHAAIAALREAAVQVGAPRGVAPDWDDRGDIAAVPADPALAARLTACVEAVGAPVERLASGAGHDAAVVAGLAPAAMLFVRCRGGVSHHPAEAVAVEDVAVAIEKLKEY